MNVRDGGGTIQVGNGAGDAQHTVVGTRGQQRARKGLSNQTVSLGINGTQALDLGYWQARVEYLLPL